MSKRKPQGPIDPWTAEKKAQMALDPETPTFIYLLVDEKGAALVAGGDLPDYLRQQAIDALAWCATEARASR